MAYQFIRTDADLVAYLDRIRSAEWIALDTEFISEGKYRAELCLIQAATAEGPVLIDAPKIADLNPFWEYLCGGIQLIAHSCRSELEFGYRAIGKVPRRLYDVQLAAGFVEGDYPSSFKKITDEFLHIDIPKGETRTDWRKRPLSILQIEYALNDVLYLHDLAEKLTARLKKVGRFDWFEEETQSYLARQEASFEDERWQRTSGINGLGRRELAVVRELWRWREQKAAEKNRPAHHFLRDDLVIELAKRKTADPERIASLRGLSRRNDLTMLLTELPPAIARGLDIPESGLPELPIRESYPTYPVVTQFLMTVLHNESKKSGVALSLLAAPQDVRDFIAYRAGTLPGGKIPRLAAGWRKKLLGGILDSVLEGRTALRISDFTKNEPIETVKL